MKKILLILFCCQLLFSCDKDEISGSCQSLQDGVVNNNIDKVRTVINGFIDQLISKAYNEDNLTALAHKISSQCNVACHIMCFDCIETLPSQSEIRIGINSRGSSVGKTIDLSYTANNGMIFRSMHD